MPAITDYPAFVIAILLFLAIPGPGNLAIISSTAQGRVRGGLASTFGIIAGDQILMCCAVAGVAALLKAYPAAFAAVQWLGAAYLAYAERFKVTQAVGRYKAESGLPPADPGREDQQIARLRQLAEEAELDPEFSEKFLRFIIDEVIRHHARLQG